MPIILIFILTAAATLAAAFFYVSKIISTLPVGRAEDYLNKQSQTNKKIVACIGDSLTHGNVGQSWVDYLRLEFEDTIFLNEKKADIFLAMYHDQGLPIIKYKGFGNAVNVTLGLPFVRTSVDHGTAYDIAGTGKADARSLISAIEMAFQMVN